MMSVGGISSSSISHLCASSVRMMSPFGNCDNYSLRDKLMFLLCVPLFFPVYKASQPSLGGQNYVQLPAGSPAFTMQPSAQPQMHHVSMTSQCYPATFMAARQHYGGGSFLFSHPSGSSNSPQHAGVPYLKKRTVFPKHVTNKLRQWLKDNIEVGGMLMCTES